MQNNKLPSVSVIIPTLNAGESIEIAIRSVLQQKYPSLELIVIDGGSVEQEIQRILQYKESISYFISEKDKGIYSAINKGIEASSNEWIYVLGADDRMASHDVISGMLCKAQSDTKLIFGNIQNENKRNPLVPSEFKSSFGNKIFCRNTLHQQGVFYHRSLFDSEVFNEERKVLADYELHLKLFLNKTKAIYRPMTVAVCSAAGVSKKFNWKLYKEEIDIKRMLLPLPLYGVSIVWIVAKYLIKKVIITK
ncbi:MAG: glycosyltransferase [Bacteroidota bacterium]|nr:glycosyltransferase [Bacteroidota bacterium]